MNINFILPCRNEEENVIKFFDELNNHSSKKFNKIDFRYYFVNDASTDNTSKKIIDLQKKFKSITLINLAIQAGKDLAVIAGIENMRECDSTIIMDTDLQHPPSLVPDLIENCLNLNNSVFAKRNKIKTSIFRKILSYTYYSFSDFILGIKIQRNMTEFCILDKNFIKKLKLYNEKGISLKSIFRLLSNNFESQINFDAPKRYKGKSSFNLNDLFNLAIQSFTYFSFRPLKLVLATGALIFSLTFLLLMYMIITDILNLSVYKTITYFIVYNTSLSGLIIFLLGIIGIYIGNIQKEILDRPKFIIEKIYE